jgi:hypothetical protein
VAIERLDRATEPGGGLRGGLEPVRWRVARLARAIRGQRKRMRERLAALKPFGQQLCSGRQRRGGQRNQATGGHGIMPAPGVAARGVRIRGRGELGHARRSYGVLIKLRPAVPQRRVGALHFLAAARSERNDNFLAAAGI